MAAAFMTVLIQEATCRACRVSCQQSEHCASLRVATPRMVKPIISNMQWVWVQPVSLLLEFKNQFVLHCLEVVWAVMALLTFLACIEMRKYCCSCVAAWDEHVHPVVLHPPGSCRFCWLCHHRSSGKVTAGSFESGVLMPRDGCS